MEYKASLDTLAKVLTAGTIILLVYLSYQSIRALMVANGDLATVLLNSGALLLVAAVIGGSYLYAPLKYVLTDDSLVIKRPINNITIGFNDMVEVRSIQENETSFTLRTFGVGGLFGYFGKFHNAQLGHMTWYATKRKGKVLITTKKGKKIVITPDDAGLVDAILKKVNHQKFGA